MTREMRFTDDDLRLLKKRCAVSSDPILALDVSALIARLEAAEKVCSKAFVIQTTVAEYKKRWPVRDLLLAYEIWRKAAGK